MYGPVLLLLLGLVFWVWYVLKVLQTLIQNHTEICAYGLLLQIVWRSSKARHVGAAKGNPTNTGKSAGWAEWCRLW